MKTIINHHYILLDVCMLFIPRNMDQIRFNDPSLVRFRLDRNLLSLDLEKNRLQWNKAVPPFPKSKCPPKTAGGYSPIRVRMDRVEQYSSIQWYSPLFNIFHPYSSTKNRQISFHRWRELHDDEVRGEIHHWERRGSTRWFQRWGWLKRTNWNGDFMVIYGDFMVF